MDSKKLKRKKLKCRKSRQKLKGIKRKKKDNSGLVGRSNSEESSQPDEETDNRLSDKKKYSRSYISDNYVSKVKQFSQIRERCFNYLQTVVMDNCVFYNSQITDDVLENLTLDLEQHALLACLQADIYEKSMNKIIRDIEGCTEEKKVHDELKKLLPKSTETEVVTQMKTEKFAGNSPVVETYSRIPTISSTRTDYSVDINESELESQPAFYTETLNPYYSPVDKYPQPYPEPGDQSWICNENYTGSNTNTAYWNNVIQLSQANEFNQYSNEHIMVNSSSNCVLNGKPKPISRVIPQTSVETEKVDPLIMSLNQLQRSVEETLNQSEKVKKQKKEEKEKAYIAHILEGEDSLDDKFDDSLSDNENESKENENETNLMDRLERMRELFGMEEEKQVVIIEKPKVQSLTTNTTKVNHVNNRNKGVTVWRHEKVIHLYKFAMLSSEMSLSRRERNQRLFLELFGEDSDEEHEEEYRSHDKFRASCTERISSWVVKYLMPYYHDKRINSRNVFKSLGHHISDSIVDKIQYPDQWTVKYFVSKFFPPRKEYVCDADVLAFQLD